MTPERRRISWKAITAVVGSIATALAIGIGSIMKVGAYQEKILTLATAVTKVQERQDAQEKAADANYLSIQVALQGIRTTQDGMLVSISRMDRKLDIMTFSRKFGEGSYERAELAEGVNVPVEARGRVHVGSK